MNQSKVDPSHCILTRQYAVYTPPIDEMAMKIGDWLDQQRPGGFIYGASRFGKSRAIRWYLADVLAERFGAVIPLVIWNRRTDQQATEAAFWHQLLLASKFQFVNPAKAPKKTEGAYLCLQRFIAIAKSAGQNYVVLLIDEAQDVTLREWKWLVGLQNQLDYGRLPAQRIFCRDAPAGIQPRVSGEHRECPCGGPFHGGAFALSRHSYS
jgi:hypothetical protein